jgi:hypothetical protein
MSRDEARQQPLYARMLGLQYLAPSGFLCFVFLEGAVALGILLALAELVSWWGVLVLPAMVAVMVKLNDVVAGKLIRRGITRPAGGVHSVVRASEHAAAETVRLSASMIAASQLGGASALRSTEIRHAAVPGGPIGDRWTPPPSMIDAIALNEPPVAWQWEEPLDDRQQRARQSAARRYE